MTTNISRPAELGECSFIPEEGDLESTIDDQPGVRTPVH